MRLLFVCFFVFVLSGCATPSKFVTERTGPFLQVKVNNEAIFETNQVTVKRCEIEAVSIANEFLKQELGKMSLESGRLGVGCSSESKKSELNYAGVLINEITGEKTPMHFKTERACVLVKPSFDKINGFLLDCN